MKLIDLLADFIEMTAVHKVLGKMTYTRLDWDLTTQYGLILLEAFQVQVADLAECIQPLMILCSTADVLLKVATIPWPRQERGMIQ
jgi:hypothetical protein